MAGKREIAFLCHPYHRGGVTRWMADAAMDLDAKGHKAWFITVAPESEFYSAKGRESMVALLAKKPNNVALVTVKAGYEFEFGTDEYRTYVYKRLIARVPQGTPIILSDSAPTWAAATALSDSYPIIGVLHADEGHYYELAEQYHERVDLFACVSGRVAKTVAGRVPAIDKARIHIIPCGIELPEINRETRDNGPLRLTYVGRITEYQKRVSDLVKIAARLNATGVGFQMNIIGDGTDRPALEEQMNKEDLKDKVSFTGWLSQQEVANHLRGSDMLLLTSDFEGTPIAMMEALAAGCGVVGARVSGIEDYEHHPMAQDCYRVFETGDIQAATDRIKELSLIERAGRVAAARRLAAQEFSMDVCLARYLDCISQIPSRDMGSPIKISMPLMDHIYSRAIALARYGKLKLKGG